MFPRSAFLRYKTMGLRVASCMSYCFDDSECHGVVSLWMLLVIDFRSSGLELCLPLVGELFRASASGWEDELEIRNKHESSSDPKS